MTIIQFFSMGGYAAYVWPSFAIVLIGMVILWVISDRGWRKSEKILAIMRDRRKYEGNDPV